MARNLGKSLTEDDLKFIFENKGKMKQKDIAQILGVTASCVNHYVRIELNPKEVIKPGCFDIVSECKKWGI